MQVYHLEQFDSQANHLFELAKLNPVHIENQNLHFVLLNLNFFNQIFNEKETKKSVSLADGFRNLKNADKMDFEVDFENIGKQLPQDKPFEFDD